MKFRFRTSLSLVTLTVALLLSARIPAAAANRTWDGSANGLWSNPANWVGGVAPVAGDSLTFPVAATRYVTTNNFPASTAFGGIAIHGSNYFFRGNSLVLRDDLRALATGGGATFDLPIVIDSPLAATQLESRYGCVLRFNQTLDLAQPDRPVQLRNGVIRVAGAIVGPGRIEIAGGDVYFEGSVPNTFSGSLQLSGCNLYLNKSVLNGAIPADCQVESSGAPGWVRWLRDDQVASTALFRRVALDLNNQSETVHDFHTSCILSNGTLSLNYNILGSGPVLSGNGNGRIHLNVGNHQIVATNTATLRNEITGPGNLFVDGSSWTWLERSNSFTGVFTVFDGVVAVRDAHALGTTNGGTVVWPGATLMLRNNVHIEGEPLALSGSGFSDPDFALSLPHGFGALHAISTSNVWTGPVTIEGLTTFGVQAEGLGPNQTNAALHLSGPLSGTGPIVKHGLGSAVFTGASPNTYTSSTFVWEGTLQLDKTGANAIASATLEIGGSDPTRLARVELRRGAQIPDAANVTVRPGAVLDLNNQSDVIRSLVLFDGTVDTGTGALVVAENLYGIDDAKLPTASRILGQGRLLFSPASHQIILDGDAANPFALEIACEVGGSGDWLISGDGSLFLGHSNSFFGAVTMAAKTLGLGNPFALGGAAHGTAVQSNATVALYGVTVAAEPLTLHHGATIASAIDFPSTWRGPISLPEAGGAALARSAGAIPNTPLILDGPLSGPGPLRIAGGEVVFAGTQDNTQSGEIQVQAGTLLLSKTNATAIAGRLRIGTSSLITPEPETVLHLRPHQLADDVPVYLHPTATWNLNSFPETIGALGGTTNSSIVLGSADLTVDLIEDLYLLYAGVISGTGRFIRTGPEYSLLTGDNTYTGATRVEAGWLSIWGTQPQSDVGVAAGAGLSGFGTIGHLDVAPGATFAPGELVSEPAMTTSNLTLQAGSIFRATLWGPQSNKFVRARGTVSLQQPTLSLEWRYLPSPGDSFTLIDRHGNDPVSGTFAGIPPGLFVAPNGLWLEITYGNDVTLKVVSPGQATFPPGIGVTVLGGNGNGAIDPNECNQLRIQIANFGTNDLPPFKTMLVADHPAAVVTQPASDYPAIPAQASAENLTPFQISTTDKLECGTNLPARLLILTTNGSAFVLDLPLPTGAPAEPKTFSASPEAPILDGLTTESAVEVADFPTFLADVQVSVFLEHTRSSDLQIVLVAPDGTEVLLAEDMGAGANYGTGCAANARTQFSDHAAASIVGAAAPFVGLFRPQGYLSTLRGLPASAATGKWTLRVTDHVHFNTGSLRCWSLTLAPAVCTDGGGACTPCPPPIFGSLEPGDPVAPSRLSVFSEASNCFSNKACPPVLASPVTYHTHAFTNLSSQASCVTVVYTPLCDVNPLYDLNVAAYLGSFVPADVSQNFLASAGAPASASAPRSFSFQAPAEAGFEIVIAVAGNPACAQYQLEVLSPDLCPVSLHITKLETNAVRLDWPLHAGGYELQSTTGFPAADWSSVTPPPIVTAGRFTVTNSVAPANRFYRLRRP